MPGWRKCVRLKGLAPLVKGDKELQRTYCLDVKAEFDVVVLGAGVSGTAAALAAAQSGARVCVMTGPPGASALFAGAWRGPCPEALRSALAQIGYVLHARETALPHAAGHVTLSDFATAPHLSASLDDGAVVCAIAGLPAFDAPQLARQWSHHSGAAITATSLLIDNTPASGWATTALAAQIERSRQSFSAALRALGARRIILPAVLGRAYDGELHARLANEAGCAVGEALAMPPSLPGWRLHGALRAALGAAGVTIVDERAVAHSANGRVEHVTRANGDVVHARTFILATGKFIGGGIEAGTTFREPALDCPVWVEHLGDIFETPDALNLTDPVRTEAQPILCAGVHVDQEQRPLNPQNDVVYSNVVVAGSIRAGWQSTTHGAGHAAEDGWNAGLRVVKT